MYVSNDGNDNNDGSYEHPVASLQAAQRLARLHKTPTQGVTVWIEPGYYTLSTAGTPASSWEFTPEDSGTTTAPISYVGTGDPGSVIVSGAVPVRGWARNENNAHIWTASLPKGMEFTYTLFADGQRQTPARTGVLQYNATGDYYIQYKPGQLDERPRNPTDVRLVLYETWTASVHQISGFIIEQRIVNFTNKFDKEWAAASGGRFYFENLLEALDSPGEFYIDRLAGTVSWFVPNNGNPNEMLVVTPTVAELLTITGEPEHNRFVEHLKFVNISLMHSNANYTACFATACNWQSGNFSVMGGVHVRGGRNIEFTDVVVAHVGGYGVWLEEGTFNNTLTSLHVYDVGIGAVRLGVGQAGSQHNPLLRSSGNSLTNSILEDGGYEILEGCGVLAQSVSQTDISHNIITNFYYTGVSLGWTWGYAATDMHNNSVTYNAINTIGKGALSDMGGVYTLGISPGSRVENNVVHSVNSFGYGAWAYYTDEGSTNYSYINNIAFNTKCAGHHQHYGMDNLLLNNIYAFVNVGDCDCGARNSQHGGANENCSAIDPATGEDMGQCSSFKLNRNIIRPVLGDSVCAPVAPYAFLNCSVDLNVHWGAQPSSMTFPTNMTNNTFAEFQLLGKDVHGIVADPLFVNGIADEYTTLMPSSPALARGFQLIDISNVGPARPPAGMTHDRFKQHRQQAFTFTLTPDDMPRATPEQRLEYQQQFESARLGRRRHYQHPQ